PRFNLQVNLDGDWGAGGGHIERRSEPSLRQDRWVDAAGDLPEFFERISQPVRDPIQPCLKLAMLGRCIRLDGAQLQGQYYQPLLDAVVQVALDPAPGLVG